MKKISIIYWVTTILFSIPMIMSAMMYLTNDEVKGNFIKMGFNDAFRVELALGKIIGVVVLLIPIKFQPIKEWAYAGFAIVLISAGIAHNAAGDPVSMVITPFVFLVVLGVSWYTNFKRKVKNAGFE